jgi:hypothetical protein
MSQKNQPTTRGEWFSHVEQQEQSGLTQAEYCKQHYLVACRFSYYRQLVRKQKINLPISSSFIPVVSTPPANTQSAEIRVELPNGFRCYVPSQINPVQLKHFIGVLLSC